MNRFTFDEPEPSPTYAGQKRMLPCYDYDARHLGEFLWPSNVRDRFPNILKRLEALTKLQGALLKTRGKFRSWLTRSLPFMMFDDSNPFVWQMRHQIEAIQQDDDALDAVVGCLWVEGFQSPVDICTLEPDEDWLAARIRKFKLQPYCDWLVAVFTEDPELERDYERRVTDYLCTLGHYDNELWSLIDDLQDHPKWREHLASENYGDAEFNWDCAIRYWKDWY